MCFDAEAADEMAGGGSLLVVLRVALLASVVCFEGGSSIGLPFW